MYICGHWGGGTASSVTRARRKALEASPPMRRAPRLARATAAGPERVLVSSTETILCASAVCVCVLVFVHACGYGGRCPLMCTLRRSAALSADRGG